MARDRRLYPLGLEERDGLNRKLGGGLPVGSMVLMEGGYGAGKSALSQRFAYGLCETGNYVCYLTPELDLMSFLEQMDSLNYEVEDHILGNRLAFSHISLKSGGEYVQKLVHADKILNGAVLLIDAFDQILRNDEEFDTLIKRDMGKDVSSRIVEFFRDLIRQDKTIITTIDPSNLSEDAMSPFRSMADVYLVLKTIDVGGEIRRTMEVKRFSGMGKQVGDSIGYSVRAGVGIVMESRSVV